MSAATTITGLAHVGIRVYDLPRARAFYEKLGFDFVLGPVGPESVVILRHPSGLEINLIVNATDDGARNVLMDVPEKHPGYTHIALRVTSVAQARALLNQAGVAISGTRGDVAVFARDPDRNVIEFAIEESTTT